MNAALERINGVPVLRLRRTEVGSHMIGSGKRHEYDLVLTDEQVNKIRIHTGADFT